MIFLFDLDGTLTDPAVGITRSIQYALAMLGCVPPPSDDLTRFIGPPLRATFAELLATADVGLIADAVNGYRERFATVGLFENAVYTGVPEVLTAVRDAGHRAFVVTSKPHVYARRIVDHFGLSQWLEDVFGSELSGENTDKGDLIRVALERVRAAGERAWMIGDRGTDIVGARVNSIGAIAAAWGYGGEAELREACPDLTFATPAELRAFVTAFESR